MNLPAASMHRPAAVLGAVLLIVGLAAAWSIDVPRTTYGIKSDEATYVAMALSLVHDRNLSYERRDLERFSALYHSGPKGIFLKPGKQLRIRGQRAFPFVRLLHRPDPDNTRLYYGKAFLYSAASVPFVALFGLNGFLVFHVVMLALVSWCAYRFLTQHSPPLAAAAFVSAFLGAAAFPIYGVFLMPEVFNFTLVFVAYFLWLHRDVRPQPPFDSAQGGLSVSRSPDATSNREIWAAVLLGLATYSKPLPVAFLVAPLVLLAWWQRRVLRGFVVGAVAVAAAVVCFGVTALVSGEFNYQGGAERRTYQEGFPFETPDATWESRPREATTTDGTAAAAVLTSPEAPRRFIRNIGYFLFGRHFGFVPYYFPGIIAIAVWLLSPLRRDPARVLIFACFVLATVGLLLVLPFTWSGGGGPPGNRYLLSAYPVLFFLVPPLASPGPGVLAWTIGALFTAKMLINPFASAKFTWELFEAGPARLLPVELSMANDLPVMLTTSPLRGRITYRPTPDQFLLLYFLDQNASPPEPEGMWVTANGRADIIVRAVDPIDHLEIEAQSPVRTLVTVSLGSERVTTTLEPGVVMTFNVPAGNAVQRDVHDFAYLMRAEASDGFVPHLRIANGDYRNLGAQLRFRAVYRPR
jgi:hypothetical protein